MKRWKVLLYLGPELTEVITYVETEPEWTLHKVTLNIAAAIRPFLGSPEAGWVQFDDGPRGITRWRTSDIRGFDVSPAD